MACLLVAAILACILAAPVPARAQSVALKCQDLASDLSAAVNSLCCPAGGCSASNAWTFPDECSAQCARAFMPLFSQCADQLFAEGAAGTRVGKRAVSFEAKCATAAGRTLSAGARRGKPNIRTDSIDPQSFELTGSAALAGVVLQLTQTETGQQGSAHCEWTTVHPSSPAACSAVHTRMYQLNLLPTTAVHR